MRKDDTEMIANPFVQWLQETVGDDVVSNFVESVLSDYRDGKFPSFDDHDTILSYLHEVASYDEINIFEDLWQQYCIATSGV